jgi:hypothetical protein
MEGHSVSARHVDPVTKGRDSYVGSSPAKNVDGRHDLDLLKAIGKYHEHGWRGHGIH